MNRRISALAALLGGVCAFLAIAASASADAPVAQYEVSITNLTEGQPLTPPVVATHRAATGVFAVGQPASFGLKEIARTATSGR